MSVIKDNNDGKTRMYLSISQGKLCRRHKEAIEGVTESRTNKNDKVVHEEFFDGVQGKITKVFKEVVEDGKGSGFTNQQEQLDTSFEESGRHLGHHSHRKVQRATGDLDWQVQAY